MMHPCGIPVWSDGKKASHRAHPIASSKWRHPRFGLTVQSAAKACKLAAGLVLLCAVAGCFGLRVTDRGHTAYTVVLPADATPAEHLAGQELADVLGQMTGALYPVVVETDAISGPKIVLGCGTLARAVIPKNTLKELGPEEFIIKTDGDDLILAGGRPRGTLYAVYHLLDNVLGVRWWAPGATDIPKVNSLKLDRLDIRLKPTFEYRDAFITTAWDPDWAARNRLNGLVVRDTSGNPLVPDERHGGGIQYSPSGVHSFNALIPSGHYFDAHPNWFPMIGGKRVKGYYQLCLSNPEVADFMVEQVRATMKQNPLIRIFSISQNDAHGNCQCPDCARIDAEEGSPSGSLVRFVNTVAERLEKEYPDIRFDTLAYQYTRKSPAIVKPRRNVIIRLCSYECSFSQPLDSAANLAFADDLKAWAKIADNIYIWDYIANFGNFIRPHPNLRVLGPNLRFFAANRVKGIFEQGSYGMHSGEMEELRAWVLARLMWNPWQDDRALIEEFVTGYYGAAAPYVREYLKMTHDAVETNTFSLSCWSGDPAPHVTFDTMSKAAELFGKAEAAVADRPSLLVRVRRAHMPVQVMWLIHYPEWAAEAKTRGRPAPLPFATIFDAFKAQVQTNGVLYIAEGKNIGPWLEQIQAARVPVKVSGCFGGSMPWYFCDGDPKTGVALGGFGPQWVQRDLESIKKVKSIVTDFGSHYNEIRYRIEASADEVSWTAIVPDKILKGYVATDAFPTSVEARFIKTIILHAASVDAPNQWVSMAEQTISTE